MRAAGADLGIADMVAAGDLALHEMSAVRGIDNLDGLLESQTRRMRVEFAHEHGEWLLRRPPVAGVPGGDHSFLGRNVGR